MKRPPWQSREPYDGIQFNESSASWRAPNFRFGRVGSLSDAQLLDRFVSNTDETAEAAFEELMIRDGPMVLRVCQSALQDSHDAHDAFQAVFLILANRARVIRRKESVGSWLFGVAHRVAVRARHRATRRLAIERLSGNGRPKAISRLNTIPTLKSCIRNSGVCPNDCGRRSFSATWKG